ncbi:hypothetical protein Q7C36_020613 [Tachysurus vachellii]|uniref:Uncharacterized protein n=1 Tax=Tachysurus vachellii TaxID=175792 RepID=A0AA88IW60_TACVA|nr:hypothetical protein Q7C36_020613 [Tachysurus vachellii]
MTRVETGVDVMWRRIVRPKQRKRTEAKRATRSRRNTRHGRVTAAALEDLSIPPSRKWPKCGGDFQTGSGEKREVHNSTLCSRKSAKRDEIHTQTQDASSRFAHGIRSKSEVRGNWTRSRNNSGTVEEAWLLR